MILLLGGTGQLGFELKRALAPFGRVISPNRKTLDLMNEKEVDSFLNNNKLDLIVNAAAWTDVDGAEKHKAAAFRLNTELPKQLACFSKINQLKLIHFSTDYVFDGADNIPWDEESNPNPINFYGETKFQGDELIKKNSHHYLIFRISWVYGARGKNFLTTILKLAKTKTELNIVSDQIGAPSPARLIAQVTAIALNSDLESGVYNLSCKGGISWLGFAKAIFKHDHIHALKLKMGHRDIHPIETNEYNHVAVRPLNSLLDTTKLEKALKIELPHWESQLTLTLDEYFEKLR
jgi:dTDP-4-dehydrorhamnose reductase